LGEYNIRIKLQVSLTGNTYFPGTYEKDRNSRTIVWARWSYRGLRRNSMVWDCELNALVFCCQVRSTCLSWFRKFAMVRTCTHPHSNSKSPQRWRSRRLNNYNSNFDGSSIAASL